MRALERLPIDIDAFGKKYGPWVVIAGASDGTGATFAEQLAEMGLNLVLVARRKEVLDALAARLSQSYGVQCRVLVADLSEEGAGDRLVRETADLDVGLYISNAGADGAGYDFLMEDKARAHRLIRMNIITLLDAVHGFGNRFRQRGGGGVVIMASGVGLGGQAMLSMYSSTKGFELNLSEALWAEWQDYDIDVIGIAAPLMYTPTLQKSTVGALGPEVCYDAADVTHNALAGLQAGDPLHLVPDGPGEERLPQMQAERKARVLQFLEFSKSYRPE